MSKGIASLVIRFTGDTLEFTRAADKVKSEMAQAAKSCESFGKSMSLYVTAPLTAMGAASISLADIQLKAEAKVRQSIKTTGGAAKLSFNQLKSFAAELQGKTLFGDEKTLNDSTAQLLTFTNIAGENFKRTQAIAQDLATVLDGDLKSASIQLGKALNDPVKNLSALSRAGIQFSSAQTTTIKHLAETNRLAEAQGLILDELARQYGGQAAEAASVGTGPLQQAMMAYSDIAEQIGMVFMPTVQSAGKYLLELAGYLSNTSSSTMAAAASFGVVAAAIGPVSLAIGALIRLWPTLKMGLMAITSWGGLAAGAFVGVTAAIVGARAAVAALMAEKTEESFTVYTSGKFSVMDLKKKLDENLRKKGLADRALGTESFLGGTVKDIISKVPWVVTDPLTGERIDREEAQIQSRQATINVDAITKAIKYLESNKKTDNGDQNLQEAILAGISEAQTSSTLATHKGFADEVEDYITRIERLKNARSSAQSVAEYQYYTDTINELQGELDRLKSISPAGLDVTTPVSLINSPGKINPLVYSASDLASTGLAKSTDEALGQMAEARRKLKEDAQKTLDFIDSLRQSIVSGVTNLGVSLAESIGESLGGGSFDNVGSELIKSMGGLIKSLGAMLMAYGIQMQILRSGLEAAWLTPPVAIALGAAMVIAGTAMTAAISKKADKGVALANGGLAFGPTMALVGDNRGAASDPEVIAPLSKLKNYIGGGNTVVSIAGGEFVLRGSDLVLLLSREEARNQRING